MRDRGSPLREAAWVLNISLSVLSQWNQGFDPDMKPYHVPDRRGKDGLITVETVKVIVKMANELKGKGRRIRLQGFTRDLKQTEGIVLSRKKVKEVLIANGLFEANTRKRRPRFYQSLRKEIPNGLLSLDGSELVVFLDGESYRFNVELGVDVSTFCHTAFSIGESESSDEVIKVLEAHRKAWGNPLGILCDSGSSNLSERTRSYLKDHDIDLVSAGPGNPKGNGTDEGAFSQMKRVLGVIQLDLSSPKVLARSVLEKLISLYIVMRNRNPVKGQVLSPDHGMTIPTSQAQRDEERQHFRDHMATKARPQDEQEKVDRLYGLIRHHDIKTEPEALKRAERSIVAFEKMAIAAAEEAFIRAVNRKAERKNLAYFFGILKRIQQERDDEAYRQYCCQRYNEEVMLDLQRQLEKDRQGPKVEDIVNLLVQAVKASFQFVRETAVRKAKQWILELASYRSPAPLKKRISEALGKVRDISLDQKTRVWELVEQFLNTKTTAESVTQI